MLESSPPFTHIIAFTSLSANISFMSFALFCEFVITSFSPNTYFPNFTLNPAFSISEIEAFIYSKSSCLIQFDGAITPIVSPFFNLFGNILFSLHA